ncbi:uncharacterized protein TRIADDRAFT_31058, partial [Trichoplax adhaerens]
RQDELKWNGWGYKDSVFHINKDDCVQYSGDRYSISGHEFPELRKWMVERCGVSLDDKTFSQNVPKAVDLPAIISNDAFVRDLSTTGVAVSMDAEDRLFRAHGHTLAELYDLRHGKFKRIPDIVAWPENHDHVVKIVQLASKHDVCIIPFGGGTTVSGALLCPENENRMILSLDTSEMDRILWVDPENFLAHVECGIIGQDLEQQLAEYGFCTGHEPDSMEFSSLGGWVATRSSGMKKNKYGNIEDMLIRVRMVTAKGTIEKSCQVPRMSTGPDIHHFILGSEGTLGVITEVTLKISPLPKCKRYGSIVFPKFENGVAFLKEIAAKRIAPASIRLLDNDQFQFGRNLRPPKTSIFARLADKLKTLYVVNFKGFDPNSLSLVTIVFEGTEEEVALQQKNIYAVASDHGGLNAGEESGKAGYMLTFSIAYLRDLGFDYSYMAESFETTLPWNKVIDACRNVKHVLLQKCKEHCVPCEPLATSRVTQVYDTGACVYFYFGFRYTGLEHPVEVYESIEQAARDEILACGGSLSHHHGVGKIRKQWLPQTVSTVGLQAVSAIKKELDPHNIFGCQNLFSKL